ncbi:solute carrier family 35 member F3 isoform X3 [Tribolium castaneum]|uniref:solute carrier family 35 member F3 isoform X3 n=1 Tax=Tribolium castaneum TaxID=7070 RepID=UPI00077DB1E2|nr:PREDICTED: putative thiamine transporter SLC35F3 isoform X3 [Tribolium castaneum]|eukprot:XP_015839143.1 PREDICTED: putative thiamine transporter SLC35F3 isoform X3 [Tribolium castaneum]
MTRDGDIPTIFNPRGRNRAPSVLVTDEGVANGPFAHADSVSSQQEPAESSSPTAPTGLAAKLKSCSISLCSKSARKIYFGIWVTICVTASWVGATHCIKYLYLQRPITDIDEDPVLVPHDTSGLNMTALQNQYAASYQAPFFTTWFVTNWTMLFFPLYFLSRLSTKRCKCASEIFTESIRGYRDKGFTAVRFMTRCSLFCLLWVGTNYMYILSLRILLATDVMALFATNVSFVYLLSWVILHEQFVGIRIMAVIICDTGVALLAYMDGITGSPTLGGVVLATSAAAGSAVYKVLFKKIIGDATYGQVALFFSLIGMLNAALLWPLSLGLFLTGVESLHWDKLPWPALLTASSLSLVANLLGNFSVALTYDLFITLGLITAVPVSAALDVVLYGANFEGMKLAGMILIAVGFFLVMFPDNWPDYITRLLRKSTRFFQGKKYHPVESQCQALLLQARGSTSVPESLTPSRRIT